MTKTVKGRELLRKRRNESKMSQIAVAANVGISQALYSLIELGYYAPSEEVAGKLCQMFNLDADYFDRREDEKGA